MSTVLNWNQTKKRFLDMGKYILTAVVPRKTNKQTETQISELSPSLRDVFPDCDEHPRFREKGSVTFNYQNLTINSSGNARKEFFQFLAEAANVQKNTAKLSSQESKQDASLKTAEAQESASIYDIIDAMKNSSGIELNLYSRQDNSGPWGSIETSEVQKRTATGNEKKRNQEAEAQKKRFFSEGMPYSLDLCSEIDKVQIQPKITLALGAPKLDVTCMKKLFERALAYTQQANTLSQDFMNIRAQLAKETREILELPPPPRYSVEKKGTTHNSSVEVDDTYRFSGTDALHSGKGSRGTGCEIR